MQGASPLASPGLDRLRHWLTLSLWYPAGACLLCRLPTLPLACFSAPIPPTPFPAGRGRFLVDFAGGFAPGTPAAEPIGLCKTDKKLSLRVIPPPAEVPVRQEQPVLRPVRPWGCKGRSPLHKNNLKFPPSPEGKGVGGMGERKHTKGKVGRRQSRQAPPRRVRDSPPAPVPPGFSPPGTCSVRSVSAANGLMQGCRGLRPRRNNLWGSPLPRRGRGVGGMGAEKNTKDRGGGRQSRQAPLPGTTAACRDNRRVFSTGTGASRGSLNDSFGKSSEGFGGLFQESPGVFLFAPQKKACNFRKNVL